MIDLSGGQAAELDLSVVVPPDDEPTFGENHALWLWDEEHRLGLYFYVKTLEHSGAFHLRRETINVHLPDGTVLMSESDGPGSGDPEVVRSSNLEARCVEPFRRWRYRLDATAQPTSAAELQAGPLLPAPRVPLAFDLEGEMVLPAAMTGSFIPGAGAATARTFYGARRYEQFVRARGTVRVAGVEHTFSGVGARTHRVGTRNLAEFPGHTWMMGLFPGNRAFCLQRFCGVDGVASWEEGYVSDGERLYPATSGEMSVYSGELPGEPLLLELRSELGAHSIRGTLRATSFATRSSTDHDHFSWGLDTSDPGGLVMPRGLAVYEWDGEQGAGLVERSARVTQLVGYAA
jgi:hypothetical protein